MKITAKLCLLHLLMWHQVNGSSVSSVTFKKTSLNLSLLSNVQCRLTAGVRSVIVCAAHCNHDGACRGFGYRDSPNKACLLIRTTESTETYHPHFEGFEYFLMKDLPSDCGQVPIKESGLTLLQLGDGRPLVVYCDQEVGGGGRLVFQQRFDGSENFYHNWEDYKVGFGKPWGEFWLGNENLHQLTKDGNHTLRVELEDHAGVRLDVTYTRFAVGDAASQYRLTVGGYVGTDPPGDSFGHLDGILFSTYDVDNDIQSSTNCALQYKGGWWYRKCHRSNLNGLYGSVVKNVGINWKSWKGSTYSLPSVRMLLQRHN